MEQQQKVEVDEIGENDDPIAAVVSLVGAVAVAGHGVGVIEGIPVAHGIFLVLLDGFHRLLLLLRVRNQTLWQASHQRKDSHHTALLAAAAGEKVWLLEDSL